MKVTLAQPSGEVPTSYNNIQDGLELPGALGLLITQAIAHCCRMEDDAMVAKNYMVIAIMLQLQSCDGI